MARWTVNEGDSELVVETTDAGRIRLDVTDGPLEVDADTAQQIRAQLGAAIVMVDGGQ